MLIRNEDIKELTAEILEGHKHLRTTIMLQYGTELVFQEAATANLVRSYINVNSAYDWGITRRIFAGSDSEVSRKD